MSTRDSLERIEQALREIKQSLFISTKLELRQMADLTNLNAAVARNTDLVLSVKTMIEGLQAKAVELQAALDDALAAGTDQAAIDAAQAAIDANNAILEVITAVAENTDAA